jgi:hypothetical protein
MCLRHIERATAGSYQAIVLIGEQQAARMSTSPGDFLLVVDVLCTNKHCFFRVERAWETSQRHRIGRSCGLGSCLTLNRCCLIALPPVADRPKQNKRRRYVLDEALVDCKTTDHQHQHYGVD